MSNRWTGGQYSLLRAAIGIALLVGFARLLPWGPPAAGDDFGLSVLTLCDAPGCVAAVLWICIVASLAVTLGWHDRVAAIVLWYLATCLEFRNPAAVSSTHWLLLLHVFLPRAPYGSLAARGRVDPGGGWRFPEALYLAVWTLLGVRYAHDGFLAWGSSWALVSFAFVPLALVAPLRGWVWLVYLMLLVDWVREPALLFLHLFAFDPAWVPARRARARETMYFDGACGLCHRSVRWVLAEDRSPQPFRFAPLQDGALADVAGLPDSIVVKDDAGKLHVRSGAVRHILARLGGLWRVLGWLVSIVPRPVRDWLYDRVAANRHRIFAKPPDACPVIPERLRERFTSSPTSAG